MLPSDTAKPDTTLANNELRERLKRELVGEYALLGAATSFGDKRMLESIYAPAAELRINNAMIRTGTNTAFALADMARKNSIKEMNRGTRRLVVIDSVVVDSGDYVIRSQRPGGEQSMERGTYVATWRRPSGEQPKWTLRRDELNPASAAPPKAR